MRPMLVGLFAVVALVVGSLVLTPYDVEAGAERKVKTIEVSPAAKTVEKPARKQVNVNQPASPPRTTEEAVAKAVQWLVSVQGNNGGWGQDGGETSFVRVGENLESNGNDVANTAVATLALVAAGQTPNAGKHGAAVRQGLEFILRHVEESPEEGLAVTAVTGTQIQRKLGSYIPTFLSARLLAELEGEMEDPKLNQRVRQALQKCVRKIENNQHSDGSWNSSGGWAPILGTSIASRSLAIAKDKKLEVSETVLARVDDYTKQSAKPLAGDKTRGSGVGTGRGAAVGLGRGIIGGVYRSAPADASSAGVALYKGAQVLEQLSRSEEDREMNRTEIAAVTGQLANERYVHGYGSFGGEEFFSYLNISDSLHRMRGEEWENWNGKIKPLLIRLQNDEGSWAGHHCITGRVAVTSAAVLTLLVDQQPQIQPALLSTAN